jgi:hypothetical protein
MNSPMSLQAAAGSWDYSGAYYLLIGVVAWPLVFGLGYAFLRSLNIESLTALVGSGLGSLILTLVILVVVAQFSRSESQRKWNDENQLRIQLTKALRDDPEIVLRERWPSSDQMRKDVFNNSFSQPKPVNYSADQLRRLYSEAPVFQRHILSHANCDPEWLAEMYEQEKTRAKEGKYEELIFILRNPRAPSEWLTQTASSTEMPERVTYEAKRLLDERQRSTPTPRPSVTTK